MRKLTYYFSDEFIARIFGKLSDRTYLIAILLFGILVRGRQYLTNRSFWLDEAFLANNFKQRDFMQLLEPLDYSQVAPIGFLWVEKLMGNLFGVNEFSLRLVPFLASIAAIYLLYDLGRVLLSKKWGLLIAFAFTLPLTLTYFSSELKQYMTDLSIALLLFWYYYRFIFQNKQDTKAIITLGILGAICVWFSNITPILLLSIGLALWLPLLKAFNSKRLFSILTSNALWLVSFLPYYFNFIKNNPHREGMVNYWSSAFLPHQPKEAYEWIVATFEELFRNTASHYEMTFLALGLFIVGVLSVLIRKTKWHYLYLFLPILIHLQLSYFRVYPFTGRLILYLIPLIIFFEFVGIEYISGFFKTKKAVVILFSLALLSLAFLRTPNYFVHPMMGEDIKPVLQYVKEQKEQNDIVYAYSGAHAAFKFYKDKYFTTEDSCIVGISSGDYYNKFIKEFEGLKGRVWVVFSHMNPPQGLEYINSEISKSKQLDYFEAEGAKVYLISK